MRANCLPLVRGAARAVPCRWLRGLQLPLATAIWSFHGYERGNLLGWELSPGF
ncbi:uncharacterized protein P884DRAFT_264756 [Thermothelomyces heterothallicus CBS 202.75]|uniref:uncharacterized protein n=1 Tax=Thermothelomyces heterothallicus CBS 202.75 TaxID=1149848 RepID=UPI00374365AF